MDSPSPKLPAHLHITAIHTLHIEQPQPCLPKPTNHYIHTFLNIAIYNISKHLIYQLQLISKKLIQLGYHLYLLFYIWYSIRYTNIINFVFDLDFYIFLMIYKLINWYRFIYKNSKTNFQDKYISYISLEISYTSLVEILHFLGNFLHFLDWNLILPWLPKLHPTSRYNLAIHLL